VPTLVIGAQHDTMDPKWMRKMAGKLPNGTYLHCPNGSHMAMYDDQATYYDGLIDWIGRVDRDS
jgi:proline iminopeptidase